ncbi:MAG: hypothetical protein ACTHMM_21200 [Agriterribacter sp.]
MAYSILQQPTANSLQYSNGDIVAVVQQSDYDPVFYKDYKFWAKLKVNGIESVTLKSFPEPGTDKGIINLNGIASAFTKYDYIFNNSSIFAGCPGSSCELQLMLGEEYNYNGTWFSQEQTSGNTFISLNAAPVKNEVLSDYVLGALSNKFLNKATEIKTSSVFGDQYLFYYTPVAVAKKLEIVTFSTPTVGDYSGLRGIYRIDNPFSDNSGVQRAAIGLDALQAINDEGEYSVIFGESDLLNPSVKCWMVCITSDSGEKVSEVVTVYLDESCHNYPDPLQLFWLNNLGGFDSYIFNSKNFTTTDKTVQSFKKQSGKLVGNNYVANTYDQTNINYFTQLQDSIEISANWVTDNEVHLLHSLFKSSVVFYRGTDNVMYAGTIETTSYPIKRRRFQKRNDITLKLKPSKTYNTQLQ